MDLTVVILSCRRLALLRRTLEAIRPQFESVEPSVAVTWNCFDNGSSEADQRSLASLGFDLLLLSKKNLGQGPALNVLLATVRSRYFLLLEDDWVLENGAKTPFVRESIEILEADPKLGQVKLDELHSTDFSDRKIYDGPFYAPGRETPYHVQNPAILWGGFCCPPAITRTQAVREVGPFIEEEPFKRWFAESEYSQRFARRYFVCKSPDMLVFKHIGDEPSPGWKDAPDGHEQHGGAAS